MAGTFFGIGLSQPVDIRGRPIAGALLYVYDANTSTPVSTFADYNLSTLQTWPVAADAVGRLPQLWVDDGSYRVRLTTSAGIEIFDEQSITAIGPSSGDTSQSATVDSTSIFDTGDVIWVGITGTRTGWVRCNGTTVGSGSSSATGRANSDTQALFEYLWNNYSDTLCPVGSGRGASATADFNANKAIGTLDLRGRSLFGLDDMGSSAASRLVAGTPTAVSSGGAEKQTIAQANLPNVSFTVSGTAATHTHTYSGTTSGQSQTHTHSGVADVGDSNAGTGNQRNEAESGTTGNASVDHTHTYSGTTAASGTLALTATAASGGSGTTLATTPPYMLGTWHMKL